MAIQTQRYEILEGKHVDEGEKVYRKGDQFESPHPDLVERFPNRFRKIEAFQIGEGKVKIRAKIVDVVEGDQVSLPLAPVSKEDAALAARGTDVTGDFKLPKAASTIKVFSREGVFHAYEETSTTPLNQKGLKKDAVLPFITKWLEE